MEVTLIKPAMTLAVLIAAMNSRGERLCKIDTSVSV
jgi:hypothetical protein